MKPPAGVSIDTKLLKFLVAGGTAFSIEYGGFLALKYGLTVDTALAGLTSFAAGLLTSFALNRNWSFKSDNFHKSAHVQLVLYGLLAAVNAAISTGAVVLLERLGLAAAAGKIVIMAAIMAWNYLIFRHVIFRHVQPPQ